MSSPEIEEIKNRLNIAEVVGEYIRLMKAGSNWKALCPFHNEKTPSFMVSEERGSWHCFGCGKGGDVFSFVMELEGVGFREALEQLAAKAGVELPKRIGNREWGIENRDEKKNLYAILELAAKWYEKNLWEGKGKEKILRYLRERGLSDESIKKFRLGYAPDGWRNVLEFLTKKGYSVEEINKTGLLVEKIPKSEILNPNQIQNSKFLPRRQTGKTQNSDCYDRFRDRIIFPIQDILGRIVGYSARVAPGGDEKSAKYVNSPQTVLYDKSKILYGLNFAKVEIKKRDETILVEGNTDVIASHQAGFPNTVAVSGTALTDDQVKILKRYSENIKMGFDMDAAGQAAARRSIKTCLENDLNVKIILLSAGKDAADSLRENPQNWKRSVESAQGVMEYYFKEAFSRYDAKKPTEKKKIARELLNVIKDISNPVEQSHWLKILAERLGTDEKILLDILRNAKLKGREPDEEKTDDGNQRRKSSLEQKIIGILLAFGRECHRELAQIETGDFQDDKNKAIMEAIKANDAGFNLGKLKALFSDWETEKFLDEAAFEAEVRFDSGRSEGDVGERLDPVSELRGYVKCLREKRKKEKALQIVQDIKSAEAAGDKAGARLLMKEFQKLVNK